MSRAIFLDRDGVINANRPDYVKNLDEFVLLPNTLQALRLLVRLPLLVVVVTNQSAVGRGLMCDREVEAIHDHLIDVVVRSGGRIDDVLYCPHRPEEGCSCRKPRPGLLLQAADKYGIDLTRSYMVGDAVTDVEAALVVGVRPVLVLTGRGQDQVQQLRNQRYRHVPVMKDLLAAARLIEGLEHPRPEAMPSYAATMREDSTQHRRGTTSQLAS